MEGRIWRVQRAILNPKTSRKDSLEGEGDGEGKGERARGGVSLQISGLDVAGLTFLELTILLGQSSKNTETTACAQKIKSTGRRQTSHYSADYKAKFLSYYRGARTVRVDQGYSGVQHFFC